MQHGKITVTVNGEVRQIPAATTVRALLDLVGVRGAAAVERNLEIVPRAAQAEAVLSDGDALEVVQLVGGG